MSKNPGHHDKDKRNYPGEWKAQKAQDPKHLDKHAKRACDRRAWLKRNKKDSVPEGKELDHAAGNAKGPVVLVAAEFNEGKSAPENLTEDPKVKRTKLRELRDRIAKKAYRKA
jgi:hypothetical protein